VDNDTTMAEGGGETTESIRKQVYEPRGRVGRRFYADVHRMANKNRKRKNDDNYHIYTVDGENFKACRITDIPAEAGDELYVDTIPVELTDEFIEVLRRGVRVFYVRRLTSFKLMYEKLGIKTNSAKNDVKVLMALETKWFREVNEDILVMRRLICAYRSLLNSRQSLMNRMRALSEVEREVLKDAIKALEEKMTTMAEIIVSEADKRIPAYNEVVRALGIEGENHLSAREALADVMLHMQRSTSYRQFRKFLGLFPGRRGVNKFYNTSARMALARLTSAVHCPEHRARDEEQLLRRIWHLKKTREKVGGAGLNSREKPLWKGRPIDKQCGICWIPAPSLSGGLSRGSS